MHEYYDGTFEMYFSLPSDEYCLQFMGKATVERSACKVRVPPQTLTAFNYRRVEEDCPHAAEIFSQL